MRRLIGQVIALCLAAIATPAVATYQDALEAYDSQDYIRAFTEAEIAAEAGDPAAQALLGALYADGLGRPRDHNEARRWFAAASAQGDAAGDYGLAQLAHSGFGEPQDAAKARGLYRQAAENGHVLAMLTLAGMLVDGEGGPMEPAEAGPIATPACWSMEGRTCARKVERSRSTGREPAAVN